MQVSEPHKKKELYNSKNVNTDICRHSYSTSYLFYKRNDE